MDYNQGVTVERDCEAILIPAGTHIKLRKGSVVFILQALGGNYTVNINGNLAQVAARDADALGFDTDLPDMQAREPGDGGVNEDMLWDQMRTCYDPEIPINIVDLGLIYDVQVKDGSVSIQMTLTAPGCGMGPYIGQQAEWAISEIQGVKDVNVELVFDPPWTPDLISEEAKKQMGID